MKLLAALLNRVGYAEALDMQEKLLSLRLQGSVSDMLLLLEHEPVITLGKCGCEEHIIAPRSFLETHGVRVYRTTRGGDVTYHGPGQIVGYPILDLRQHGCDVGGYVTKIEETIIGLLRREYGINGARDGKYRGVWIGDAKIAAIGCSVRKWVSMHGFAFNVNTCLDHFRWIIPCGIADKGVTSLEKIIGRSLNIFEVEQQIIRHFADVFGFETEILNRRDVNRITGRLSDG
jgi:lipoyl(octanoyl) transferase